MPNPIINHLLDRLRPLVRDGFNRPDNPSSLGVAETGQVWAQYVFGANTRVWGITGGRAAIISGSGSGAAAVDARRSDVLVEVTAAVTQNTMGVVARLQDTSNWLEMTYASGTTTWALNKIVAGTSTQLGSVVVAVNAGDRLGFLVVGTRLTFLLNGSAQLVVTDSTFQTATQHGLRCAGGSARFDDFRVYRR